MLGLLTRPIRTLANISATHGCFWAAWCFAMAMILPVAKVGVDWPLGYQIAVMAILGSLSVTIAPADPYVQACVLLTTSHLLFTIAWFWTVMRLLFSRHTPNARWPCGLAIGAAGLVVAALVAIARTGLLHAPHVGLLFHLAAPALLAYTTRPSIGLTQTGSPGVHDT